MSDPLTAAFDYDVRLLQPGRLSAFVALPPELWASIGAVVIQWGHFEDTYDQLLSALIVATRGFEAVPRWRKKSLNYRVHLQEKIVRGRFSAKFPDHVETLVSISQQALLIKKKRNAVAHARYVYEIQANSSKISNIKAVDPVTGTELLISERSLKELAQEISHLHGDLFRTLSNFAEPDGIRIFVEDDDLLEAYAANGLPIVPFD